MVGLQGLHLGKAFKHSNILGSMGLKSFYPWCLKLGRNSETIAVHLREVHYRMVIVCDICRLITGMTAQGILDHHSGCKAKHDKECAEHEGPEKVKKSHTEKVQVLRAERSCPNHPNQLSPRSHEDWNAPLHLPSSPAREHKLVHFLNLSGSSWLCFSSESLLNQKNCHFFLQPQCLLCNVAYINHFISCFIYPCILI